MLKLVQMYHRSLDTYGEDIDIHSMGLPRKRKKIRKTPTVKLELVINMARERGQEVKSNFPVPWKPETEGQVLEGVYRGFNLVDDERKEGDQFKSHKIKPDDSDEMMGVSGAFLDQFMERVPKGSYVWITYLGQKKVKNGMSKQFKVEVEAGVKLKDEDEIDGVVD